MATNRLYLRCKRCGQTTTIAKTMTGEWYPVGHLEDSLEAFLNTHSFCYEKEQEVSRGLELELVGENKSFLVGLPEDSPSTPPQEPR